VSVRPASSVATAAGIGPASVMRNSETPIPASEHRSDHGENAGKDHPGLSERNREDNRVYAIRHPRFQFQ